MTTEFDSVAFQKEVEDELRALNMPGWLVESKMEEKISSPPPEVDVLNALPGKGKRQRLPEEVWQRKLKQDLYKEQEHLLIQLVILEPENKDWQRERVYLAKHQQATPKSLGHLWQKRNEISEHKAKELLSRKNVRANLCKAIQAASDDVFEIAKVITPVLIGLVAAGTIIIPLLPVLFASAAFVIARMGVVGFCDDKDEKDKKKK